MNALAVAWKLRTDLMAIAMAASPKLEVRESQLLKASRGRRHRSAPELRALAGDAAANEAEVGSELPSASGDERHG